MRVRRVCALIIIGLALVLPLGGCRALGSDADRIESGRRQLTDLELRQFDVTDTPRGAELIAESEATAAKPYENPRAYDFGDGRTAVVSGATVLTVFVGENGRGRTIYEFEFGAGER